MVQLFVSLLYCLWLYCICSSLAQPDSRKNESGYARLHLQSSLYYPCRSCIVFSVLPERLCQIWEFKLKLNLSLHSIASTSTWKYMHIGWWFTIICTIYFSNHQEGLLAVWYFMIYLSNNGQFQGKVYCGWVHFVVCLLGYKPNVV